MQKIGGNPCLLICRENRVVAIRPKKLCNRRLSANHQSGQQDLMRATGFMPRLFGMTNPPLHLIVGYVETNELQPSIREIVLTKERKSVGGVQFLEWSHPLWRAGEGESGAFIPPPDIFGPTQPRYRITPKTGSDGKEKKSKEG